MTYQETLDYIYQIVPAFHQIGKDAYKPGLERIGSLLEHLGNPQDKYPTIHIAGTNGKGSTAHSLAAVLQKAGYKTGLFTSPHLVDFRERIRIDGKMIPKETVVKFVEQIDPREFDVSFFELTTSMAFDYFARERVDIAVIETGLGGRLDSSNVIRPILSVITNIDYDHTEFLGDTLEKIAYEKAGIIKEDVPVVIGEYQSPSVKEVFLKKAHECHSPIYFAQDMHLFQSCTTQDLTSIYTDTPFGTVKADLTGEYQKKNMATILASLEELKKLGLNITDEAVQEGLADVQGLTGLMGRWMPLKGAPIPTIIDTGHNPAGWVYNSRAISTLEKPLAVVLGFVSDKDTDTILEMLPKEEGITYIFTQPQNKRALKVEELAEKAQRHNLNGLTAADAPTAYQMTLDLKPRTIFMAGSNYMVGDFLQSLSKE